MRPVEGVPGPAAGGRPASGCPSGAGGGPCHPACPSCRRGSPGAGASAGSAAAGTGGSGGTRAATVRGWGTGPPHAQGTAVRSTQVADGRVGAGGGSADRADTADSAGAAPGAVVADGVVPGGAGADGRVRYPKAPDADGVGTPRPGVVGLLYAAAGLLAAGAVGATVHHGVDKPGAALAFAVLVAAGDVVGRNGGSDRNEAAADGPGATAVRARDRGGSGAGGSGGACVRASGGRGVAGPVATGGLRGTPASGGLRGSRGSAGPVASGGLRGTPASGGPDGRPASRGLGGPGGLRGAPAFGGLRGSRGSAGPVASGGLRGAPASGGPDGRPASRGLGGPGGRDDLPTSPDPGAVPGGAAPLATAGALAYALLGGSGGASTAHGAAQAVAVAAVAGLAALLLRVALRYPAAPEQAAVRLLTVAFVAGCCPPPHGAAGPGAVAWSLLILALAGLGEAALTAAADRARTGVRYGRLLRDELRLLPGVPAAVYATGLAMALAVRAGGLAELPVLCLPLLLMKVSLRRYAGVRAACRQTVASLARSTDIAGYTPGGHARRVAELSRSVGRELGLSGSRLTLLEYAALMHDIGQLSLVDPVPSGATEPLPAAEQRRIALAGGAVVRQAGVPAEVAVVVERQADPYREQPLAARIVRAVNAYVELTGGTAVPAAGRGDRAVPEAAGSPVSAAEVGRPAEAADPAEAAGSAEAAADAAAEEAAEAAAASRRRITRRARGETPPRTPRRTAPPTPRRITPSAGPRSTPSARRQAPRSATCHPGPPRRETDRGTSPRTSRRAARPSSGPWNACACVPAATSTRQSSRHSPEPWQVRRVPPPGRELTGKERRRRGAWLDAR
jgi:hypothetical protein